MTRAANLAAQASNIDSSGVAGIAAGGTASATLTANNVLLGNGTSALQAVAPGTNGNVLTSNGTTWASSAPTLTTTTGSPAYYGSRAWVNFNGVGTVAIRSSVNVSSVTDYGTGDYGINFTTAMPDIDYCPTGVAYTYADSGRAWGFVTANNSIPPTVGQLRIYSGQTNTATRVDIDRINVAIFR